MGYPQLPESIKSTRMREKREKRALKVLERIKADAVKQFAKNTKIATLTTTISHIRMCYNRRGCRRGITWRPNDSDCGLRNCEPSEEVAKLVIGGLLAYGFRNITFTDYTGNTCSGQYVDIYKNKGITFRYDIPRSEPLRQLQFKKSRIPVASETQITAARKVYAEQMKTVERSLKQVVDDKHTVVIFYRAMCSLLMTELTEKGYKVVCKQHGPDVKFVYEIHW